MQNKDREDNTFLFVMLLVILLGDKGCTPPN